MGDGWVPPPPIVDEDEDEDEDGAEAEMEAAAEAEGEAEAAEAGVGVEGKVDGAKLLLGESGVFFSSETIDASESIW